jgi:hypothetical protein
MCGISSTFVSPPSGILWTPSPEDGIFNTSEEHMLRPGTSGVASPTMWSCYANISVFINREIIMLLLKLLYLILSLILFCFIMKNSTPLHPLWPGLGNYC